MRLSDAQALHVGGRSVQRVLVGSRLLWQRPTPGFRPMPIGGGGWVTGLATGGDQLYARTDVGGAYRYDSAQDRWLQMFRASALDGDLNASDYQVEALACAPSRPDWLYASVGSGDGGRLLHSQDGGRTWAVPSTKSWFIAGNGEHRVAGSRIAVDPADPRVAYLGTRQDGLFVTSDGGATWDRLAGLPASVRDSAGFNAAGVTCVLVDSSSPVQRGRHQTLWAAVFGVGLLKSLDAGVRWTTVSPWAGAGAYVRDLVQAANGHIIGAFYAPANDVGELRRIDAANRVTDIGPKRQQWTSVAVDPHDPDKMLAVPDVMTKYYSVYHTTNATAARPTWTPLTQFAFSNSSAQDANWLVEDVLPFEDTYLWVGQVRYHGDTVALAEGRGVWTLSASSGQNLELRSRNNGIEELAGTVIAKPAGHPPVSCQWDYGYVRHTRPASLPYRRQFGSGWDIALSPTDHDFLAVLLDDHQDLSGRTYPERRASGFSTDGGATVTRFPALARGTAPPQLLFGNICVSAYDNDNLVWVPSNLRGTATQVFYTNDRGATWRQSELLGLASSDSLHESWLYNRRILVADPIQPGVFYALGQSGTGGVLWKSVDQGATWTKTRSRGLAGNYRYSSSLMHDGEALWAVPGDTWNGVFRCEDGENWVDNKKMKGSLLLALGAPMSGSQHKTVYSMGTVDGEYGIFRSTDRAGSWQLLEEHPCDYYVGVRHLAGDPAVPGHLYIAFEGGTGFAEGRFPG